MPSLVSHKFIAIIACGFLWIAGNPLKASGQPGPLTRIAERYQRPEQQYLQENIYVHTDRSFYLCGEILWYKVYLTNAGNNRPRSLSKVAYVEVLDQSNRAVMQGKIALKNGLGSGSFYIPFSLASGNYTFRAYTNWMKNGSPDLYFKKNIAIINTTRVLDSSAIRDSIRYAAGFFPEGGNLVNGIESEIAFKVNDNKGKGMDCRGVVVDRQNDTVARFQSLRFGMGHFFLQPVSGKAYTAIIILKDGRVIRQPLPQAAAEGYVMHLKDTADNSIKISVQSGPLVKAGGSSSVYLVIRNRQRTPIARELVMKDNNAYAVMDKDSLAAGISAITVFTDNGEAVSERLYFKQPRNRMIITSKADRENYSLRGKVGIRISTADETGLAVKGDLSVAVYRLDSLHHPDGGNIYNYLWLSSSLKGYIESPEYYFAPGNEQAGEAMENLLLTQGWRRFQENGGLPDILPFLRYPPEYNGHIITGNVINDATGRPAPGILVYLGVPGKRIQLYGCVSDSLGRVHFDMKDFYGASQLVVQTNQQKDSAYHIEILSPFSEKFSAAPVPRFYFPPRYRPELTADNIYMEAQNAYLGAQLQQFLPAKIDSLPFYGKPYKTYLLDDYTRFTTMEEVMREYVMEVAVRKKKGRYHYMTFNVPGFNLQTMQPAVSVFPEDPLVLLDGIPVFDIDKIIAYDPLKVKKLEVVAEKYYWGPIAADGIVSYTTYKGNLEGFSLDPRALVEDYDGLQQQRVFYSPDYSTEKPEAGRLPDFRELLYWNPDLRTGGKGEGEINFYTGDIPGEYQVVIQGITDKGEAGYAGFTFRVRK